jgi:plasmid maintenance system antidote protein VapI
MRKLMFRQTEGLLKLEHRSLASKLRTTHYDITHLCNRSRSTAEDMAGRQGEGRETMRDHEGDNE